MVSIVISLIVICFTVWKDRKLVFHDVGNKVVFNESFIYPDASEDERVEALYDSLRNSLGNSLGVQCSIKKTKPFPNANKHYCEFLGGGDIFIYKKDVSIPLVFTSAGGTESSAGETESAEREGSSVHGVKVSPISTGTSKLSSPIIEAKKGTISASKLKHQLWVNMLIVTVGNFIKALDPLDDTHESQYEKRDIFELNQLTGYGVVCSSDGMVGAYKLEMEFNKSMSFVTKLKLGFRDRPLAASLIDFTLQYYLKTVLDN